MNGEAKDKIIVALDVQTFDDAAKMIDLLSPEVEIFKVGMAPFTGFGEKILKKLEDMKKKVFLDLKFHDIPNTVKETVKQAVRKKVFMLNVHCLGGLDMMKAADEGAKEAAQAGKTTPPILLGVTILTSMDKAAMNEAGIEGSPSERALALACLANRAGLNGVVASAKEARAIKEKLGKSFIVVTPGIRPDWAASNDQKRVLTPKEAISAGADYIVVGRPIIHAKNPTEAVRKIREEIV